MGWDKAEATLHHPSISQWKSFEYSRMFYATWVKVNVLG
jgi:hypothetical protein